MKQYILYDPATGVVDASIVTGDFETVAANFTAQGIPALEIPVDADYADYIVRDGAPVLRVPVPCHVSSSGLEVTLATYPAGTRAILEGETYELPTDGTILEFDAPGLQVIRLEHDDPQYKPRTLEITL